MKKKNLLVMWFSILNLLVWSSSPTWATPLSLDQNIKTVLAHQAETRAGFDFVVTGDSHDSPEIYKRLLSRAKAFNPLFILNTGDIVGFGLASEYENYKEQIASCDIPILHVSGNHDIRFGSGTFHKYVGESDWYFDLGGFRIIGLNNAKGKFSTETVEFARKTLTSEKICLVAFHMPPAIGQWTVHSMTGNEEKGHWARMRDLIEEAKVPMVFLGHIHLYDEMDIAGTKYVISAGGGAKLYAKSGFGKSEHGFLLVHVTPEGITHQWVPLD